MTNDIAIVGYAQSPSWERAELTEVQFLFPVIAEAIAMAGIDRRDIGFTCAGSCDYLSGQTFAFVSNLEAVGAWPPISESHVEMDGAWAMYEAWVALQHGDIDVALAFGSGKSSPGDPMQIYPLQMDPYTLTPLGADPTSLAALQARAMLDSGRITERDMAAVAVRNHHDAIGNPYAQRSGDHDVDELLRTPYVTAPMRAHDLPPFSDGACAVILATAEKARALSEHPVWIRGIDHRIEIHQPGMRDLRESPSTAAAGAGAGVADGPVDIAELSVAYTHQEKILKDALGLGSGTRINPSGGPLTANPMMATGLSRIAEAARAIQRGDARRAVAHATSGQPLQQNLVCVLEGEAS